MNLKKLFTIAALTGFGASVATGQGTAPTIVQGDYISNVFGNSNFIKNPNAKLNAKDVAVSSATVTRSATTPLVATTEFNVTITSANGTVTWDARAFDAGMKNQNCEARFTYRGFQSTSKVQIKQSTNVVAELALTASTDPRIASINFPCGDLSQLTKFVVTDTSTLSGVHEIGGIYVGLATNMANVAQAEVVGGYNITASGTYPQTTSATYANLSLGTSTLVPFGQATSVNAASGSVTFANLPPGNYVAVYTSTMVSSTSTACQFQWYEDTSGQQSGFLFNFNDTSWSNIDGFFQFTTSGSRTFRIRAKRSSGGGICGLDPNLYAQMIIKRFPSSSELVVTPERQNVFGGIRTLAASGSFSTASTTNTQITGLGNFTAVGSATSVGSMQFTMPTVPVGTYKLEFFVLSEALPSAANTRADCIYTIYDGSDIYTAAYLSSLREGSPTDTPVQGGVFGSTVVRYNSVQTNKQFTVQVRRAGSGGTCASYGAGIYSAYFTITPVDQPSNSALYVQGPVKAAETGAAIPAGYLGERKSAYGNSGIGTSNSALTSIILTPGVWIINAQVQVGADTTNRHVYAGISTSPSGAGSYTDGSASIAGYATITGNGAATISGLVVNVTTTQTYYLIGQVSSASGITSQNHWLNAVRIN